MMSKTQLLCEGILRQRPDIALHQVKGKRAFSRSVGKARRQPIRSKRECLSPASGERTFRAAIHSEKRNSIDALSGAARSRQVSLLKGNNKQYQHCGIVSGNESSCVINQSQPLIGLTNSAKEQYAHLTGKTAYRQLTFNPGDTFRRKPGPVYIDMQFLSPECRNKGNTMLKVFRRQQHKEIRDITHQIDAFLALASQPDHPIYHQIKVRKVTKTPKIPPGHPLLNGKELGGYANADKPRGHVVCHYGGNLDFYTNNARYAAKRNAYCLGINESDKPSSGKRQQIKAEAVDHGYSMLLTSIDENGKWVGNAGGRINDPRGTQYQSNIGIQWLKVSATHSPKLYVDMGVMITTNAVGSGEPYQFNYGSHYFPKEKVQSTVTSRQKGLGRRYYKCGDCGAAVKPYTVNALKAKAVGSGKRVLRNTCTHDVLLKLGIKCCYSNENQ